MSYTMEMTELGARLKTCVGLWNQPVVVWIFKLPDCQASRQACGQTSLAANVCCDWQLPADVLPHVVHSNVHMANKFIRSLYTYHQTYGINNHVA